MMYVFYKTKKELRENIGKHLRFQETSLYGTEYISNGIITATNSKRSFYAQITMKDDKIQGVK